jgi:hypothetical protein
MSERLFDLRFSSFIFAFGFVFALLFALCVTVEAQQGAKEMARIGYLSANAGPPPWKSILILRPNLFANPSAQQQKLGGSAGWPS